MVVQPQGPGPKLAVQHDRVIQLLGRRCVIGGEEEHRRSTRTLVHAQRLLHSFDGVGENICPLRLACVPHRPIRHASSMLRSSTS